MTRRDDRLRFFHLSNLASVVVAAMRADVVWGFRFVALRARADRRRLERVVRPALRGARLRVPAFGIGHCSVLLVAGEQSPERRKPRILPRRRAIALGA